MATATHKKPELTHLGKIYWPEEKYTKGDVINYYDSVYKYIIKYLKGRPQSLYRTPNGINAPGFFHKNAGDDAPDWIGKYTVHSESNDKDVIYLVCNDKPSLLYLANLGSIEINPWNSTIDNPDNPDYMIMDLDPSENNTFEQVVETALVVKDILDKAGADSYCKTSGATGMHVYVPMGAKYTYDHVRAFAEIVATLTQHQLPDFTTLERGLKKRGKGNIYVDYLQNKKGATLACAYSLRPKPGAPVSTPLEWKEVKPGKIEPKQFNINNTLKRLEKKGDLFAPVLKKGIDLEKCLKRLGG